MTPKLTIDRLSTKEIDCRAELMNTLCVALYLLNPRLSNLAEYAIMLSSRKWSFVTLELKVSTIDVSDRENMMVP